MTWIIEYIKAAADHLKNLDHSQQIQVIKAIKKVSANPLPLIKVAMESHLDRIFPEFNGYLKIKLLKLGLRVVYRLVEDQEIMIIIIISVREEEKVYKMI